MRKLKTQDKDKNREQLLKELKTLRVRVAELETGCKEAERTLSKALEESTRRQAELSSLLQASRIVLTLDEFKDTARKIFDACRDLIGAACGYVALLSGDGEENEVLFLDSGGFPCTVDSSLPMPVRGLRGEAYRTGKAVYDNAFPNSEWIKYMPEGHARLNNVLFAPLVIEGKVAGLLGLANKQGGFTENDVRIASAFGELAAIALTNSRTLELLEDSEELFRSVTQTASDAIICLEGPGTIYLWNRKAEEMFGYTADEALGKDMHELYVPERYLDKAYQGLSSFFRSGTGPLVGKTVEVFALRKDGTEFPVELSIAAIHIHGKWRTTGIIRDISSRRQLEEALQESERKYRNLVENALVGIYKSDLKGDIHYANAALTRMLEFASPEELMSEGVLARYKNPNDRKALIEGLGKTGRVEDFEAELITKTGKTINILLSAVIEKDILSGMIMDITARKRDEGQLLKNHRELSALYGISSAISRTIDMDTLLNNILNTITGLDILDVERKAGIFIIEGGKMELVSHLGHTELFLDSHKDMKVGDCLCGIAAETGEIIISTNSDEDSRHTFRYPDMIPHGHIILPLKAKERVVGVLYLYLPADAELDDEKLKMLITAGDQIGMAIDHARLYEETKALSLHDPLTGLSNRHFFNKIIEREMATIKRKDETMSFIMIDLDHFKEINDTLGHLTGDRILIETANLIRNTVRKADLVFRFGGDEFLVLLTNADCDKTTNMVARLLDAVGIWNRNNAGAFGCRLSFSLGCAACEKECDVHTAIKEADARMYQNKKEKKDYDGSV